MQLSGNTWIVIAVLLAAGTAFIINSIQPKQLNQLYDQSSTSAPTSEADDVESSLKQVNPNSELIEKQLPYASQHGPLVRSLRGIYFDRDLSVDEQGNLRLASDLKDIFDFFFSAIEEEELDKVLARINEYLAYKLEEPALSQAKDALSRYVNYKSALYDFEMSGSEEIKSFMGADGFNGLNGRYLDFVSERMEKVKAMREESLDSELHEAFFQSREQYDDYMLEKLSIQADTELSAEQKNQALTVLDSTMPDEFIQQRASANPVAALRSAVSTQLNAAASSSVDTKLSGVELRNARLSAVGVEATERLEQLDAERNSWNDRYQEYLKSAVTIQENQGLSDADKNSALQSLRAQSFSESEILRVIALGNIEKSKQ